MDGGFDDDFVADCHYPKFPLRNWSTDIWLHRTESLEDTQCTCVLVGFINVR